MPTITIVLDDNSLLAVLSIMLEQEGYAVTTFYYPLGALPHLTAAPPDLAIIKGSMPKMHGTELFERLRQHENTKGVPIIFLSANAEQIERDLAERGTPADGYIQMPFRGTTIVEMVAALTNLEGDR